MKEWNENNQFSEESKNFGLPDDYFQKSAGSIYNKIEWQDEHTHYQKLMALKGINCFSVPENFFVSNAYKLELELYPILAGLSKKNSFLIPENYFEETKRRHTTLLFDEGKDDPSFNVLNSIEKLNCFAVPENYFENNETTLHQNIVSQSGKIVHLFSRRLSYSIAAMLVLALGVWMYNLYFAPLPIKDCGAIACLDKKDLVKTKTLERMDDDELYELVDPALLEKKIRDSEAKVNSVEINDSSLKGLSAEDILDGI